MHLHLKIYPSRALFFFGTRTIFIRAVPKIRCSVNGPKIYDVIIIFFTRVTRVSPLRFYNINVQLNLSYCKSLIKEQDSICDRYYKILFTFSKTFLKILIKI